MKKVLVVDDSKVIRDLVADALMPGGFSVIEAGDGHEAFARLLEHPDVGLVILDVNMPGMSGLEVLEHIQREHAARKLPILMLTTEAERALVERAKKAGAKGWLLKPVKPDLLLSAVTRLSL